MRARLFLFLAFCLALPGLRAAAADGLEIETIVTATERYLINHQWNLMVVSVRNRSAKEQTAGLRLRFGNQANLFLRTQTFAPRSTSKVYIPVYANFTEEEVEKAIKTRDNKISFSDGTSYTIVRRHGTLKCTAALVNLDNGQEYSVHDDSLFAMRGDTIFAADLFGDDQLPALPISGQYADGLPFVLGDRQEHNLRYTISQIAAATSIAERNLPEESSDISLRSCLIAPENLPAEPLFWRGLQVCYSGILKRSDGSSGLNPMQKNELLQWLAAGGQLIVMPTYDLQSYIEDPFWAALLPVTLTGTRTFSAADGAALARLIAAKKPEKELLGQIITSAVPANDCEILAAADGEVLLARRPYGAGMIYFCAFTGGALQPWSQNQKIFTLLSQIPHPPAGGIFQDLWTYAPQMMQTMIGIPAPDKTVISALMLLYLIIATILLVGLRLRKRAELGWPVLLVLAVFLFGLSYYLLRSARTEAGLQSAEIGVSVVSGDRRHNTTYFGLNAPYDINAAVRMTNPAALAVHDERKAGVMSDTFTVMQNKTPQIEKINLHVEQFWAGVAASDLRADVSAEYSFDEKGLCGRVRNLGNHKYSRVMLGYPRRTLRLPSLAPKKTAELAGGKWSWDCFPPDTADDNQKLFRQVFAGAIKTSRKKPLVDTPRIYAFADSPQAVFTLGDEATKPAVCQLSVIIPQFVPPAKGSKVRIPAGVCDLRFVGGGMPDAFFGYPRTNLFAARAGGAMMPGGMGGKERQDSTPEALDKPAVPGWLSGNGNLRLQVSFVPPVKIRPASLTLLFKGKLSGIRGRISIRRPGDEKFHELKKIAAGEHDFKIEIKDIEKYLGSDGAFPEFEFRGDRTITPGAALTDTVWRIGIFDIETTGTVEE